MHNIYLTLQLACVTKKGILLRKYQHNIKQISDMNKGKYQLEDY